MANVTRTVREALADAERRAVAQELSACIRALDHADRRAAADRDVTPYLAQAILGLDTVAKSIKEWRPRHSEKVDPYLVQEHATMKKQVDELVKQYLTHFGDADFVRLGAVAWARRVIKRLAAEKAEAEARRVARAAAKPVSKDTGVHCMKCGKATTGASLCHQCFLAAQARRGKAVIKRAPMANEAVGFVLTKMASGRPGYCDTCGKPRERKTLQGLCSDCIDAHFPTLRR